MMHLLPFVYVLQHATGYKELILFCAAYEKLKVKKVKM